MLDRLPPELLHCIVDFASPVEHDTREHEQRLSTLRNISQTCQRLRAIAHPLLWEVVSVAKGVDAMRLADEGGKSGLGKLTRVLTVTSQHTAVHYEALFEALPHVERVSVGAGLQQPILLDEPVLRTFSCIRRLSLFNCSIRPFTRIHFPHLVELSLAYLEMSPASLDHLLTPATLPALTALGFFSPTGSDSRLSLSLLDQLEALHLSFEAFYKLSPTVRQHPVAKLVSVARGIDNLIRRDGLPANSGRFSFVCTRWRRRLDSQGNASLREADWDRLRGLEALLPIAPGLQALFLPSFLHPSSLLSDTGATAMDALLAACEAAGVDIRWRDAPFSRWNDLSFCLDFLDYAKELRAKQRAGEQVEA